MGRTPCCDESGLKKGPWTPEEDEILVNYISKHGHGSWRALPKLAGTHHLLPHLPSFRSRSNIGCVPCRMLRWISPRFYSYYSFGSVWREKPSLSPVDWLGSAQPRPAICFFCRCIMSWLMMVVVIFLQVLIGAERVAGWDGRTIWDQISRGGSSHRRKRARSSVSMQSSATST